jgi:hypothetical protein
MTEALPIGNGPMGAMIFGGTDIERIQYKIKDCVWVFDVGCVAQCYKNTRERLLVFEGRHRILREIPSL